MNESKYREAERKLWESAGLTPTEQRVRLASTGADIRVQRVGTGEPVLFLHGGPNSGSTWAPVLPHIAGYECIMVDRPGTGLSEPYAVDEANLPAFGSSFVGDVLDGLGLESVRVVASSFGGHLALRSAAAAPERITRMVQMACPALVPGDKYPPFMKFMANGITRRIIGMLPPNHRANRSIFKQIGHGYSLDHDRIPQGFFDWYLALTKYTDTMRHDGNMIARVVNNRASLTLTDELLAAVPTPTLFLWGADDGFGGEDVARHIVETMPSAELTMIPNSGHLPWLDEPQRIGELTQAFLSGSAS